MTCYAVNSIAIRDKSMRIALIIFPLNYGTIPQAERQGERGFILPWWGILLVSLPGVGGLAFYSDASGRAKADLTRSAPPLSWIKLEV